MRQIDTVPLDGKIARDPEDMSGRIPEEDIPPEVREALMAKKAKSHKDARTVLALMGEKYMLTTVVYIDANAPVLKSDIYRDIARNSKMTEKLQVLEDLGLIVSYQTSRYNSNIIMITDKGREAAALIRRLSDTIKKDTEGTDGGEAGLRRQFRT